MSSIQLYQTAESDIKILGLIAIVRNSKRVLDNGRGYSNYIAIVRNSKLVLDNGRGYLNYMRITIPLTSPAHQK